MSHTPQRSSAGANRLPGGVVGWSVATAAIVAAGVAALLLRPVAPDLGPVPDPARWFSPAELARIAAFTTPLRWARIAGTVVDLAVPVLIAVTPPGRALVARVVRTVGEQRVGRAAAAVAAVVVVVASVVRLPIALWAFRHARRFGLSTQTLGGWAVDQAIEVAVLVVGAALLVGGGYALAARWPRRWALVAGPVGLLVIAGATLAGPLLLEPLRYDTVPLAAGPVRDELDSVLAADGRAGATVLVADASRRTTRQNAYVSGLAGTRRVVLFDTLLERPAPQVGLVVAHELVHDRNRDLTRGVLAGAAGLVLLCAVIDRVARHRTARGRQRGVADPFAAGVVVAVLAVALIVTTPVVSWASRRVEAAADLGSLQLTGAVADYCAVQRGLVVRNLSDPAPPTWARLWWWSHPPAASRLELAARLDADACDGAR